MYEHEHAEAMQFRISKNLGLEDILERKQTDKMKMQKQMEDLEIHEYYCCCSGKFPYRTQSPRALWLVFSLRTISLQLSNKLWFSSLLMMGGKEA